MVVDKYKSGFEPPPNIPFEDLNGTTVSENHNHSNSAKTLKTTEKMTMSGGKGKKRGGLFGIFGGSKVSGLVGGRRGIPGHVYLTLLLKGQLLMWNYMLVPSTALYLHTVL